MTIKHRKLKRNVRLDEDQRPPKKAEKRGILAEKWGKKAESPIRYSEKDLILFRFTGDRTTHTKKIKGFLKNRKKKRKYLNIYYTLINNETC
tara:strand:+ start:309 stop:584 length:276 start_codon:yes stop_codon:yes gene_type:complete